MGLVGDTDSAATPAPTAATAAAAAAAHATTVSGELMASAIDVCEDSSNSSVFKASAAATAFR